GNGPHRLWQRGTRPADRVTLSADALQGGSADYPKRQCPRPQDGPLAGSSFSWEVLQHHTAPNSHTQPYFSDTGNDLNIDAPTPEDFSSTDSGNYLEVRLTVTDSNGLS